jgi:hypothetical protein
MKTVPEVNGVEFTVTGTFVCVFEIDVTVVVITTVVVVGVMELLVLVVELIPVVVVIGAKTVEA